MPNPPRNRELTVLGVKAVCGVRQKTPKINARLLAAQVAQGEIAAKAKSAARSTVRWIPKKKGSAK